MKKNVSFNFNDEKSVFHSAQSAGVLLDHSCLVARCSSCKVRVLSGNTVNIEDKFVLNDEEKN
ncbi:2Fe-2S iron-sulfur cluster binding domain-containing protein [Flavobacteriales bacterium]|nr:2Fe-2S iron-sulfur cluster binding domain-containing protein [Flavobacteriales bacterium]